jgi:hypothetical protein
MKNNQLLNIGIGIAIGYVLFGKRGTTTVVNVPPPRLPGTTTTSTTMDTLPINGYKVPLKMPKRL